MQFKKGWWLTGYGGKEYIVYQSKETGKYYKIFSANNYQEAKNKALKIIEEYEQNRIL